MVSQMAHPKNLDNIPALYWFKFDLFCRQILENRDKVFAELSEYLQLKQTIEALPVSENVSITNKYRNCLQLHCSL